MPGGAAAANAGGVTPGGRQSQECGARLAAMGVSGPGPGREPAQWLTDCKVTALLPARSARLAVRLPAIRRHSARDCHVSTGASAQLKRLVSDFADPLGSPRRAAAMPRR